MTDMYVQVDNNNAGKPKPTINPNLITWWKLREHVEAYQNMFAKHGTGFPWVIKEVEFKLNTVY